MTKRGKRSHAMELYRAIMRLKDEEECFAFFQDLCSDNEMLAMEQRYQVAKMLEDGKTYLEIQRASNASTATISRVGRVLSDGTGAMAEVLERDGGGSRSEKAAAGHGNEVKLHGYSGNAEHPEDGGEKPGRS